MGWSVGENAQGRDVGYGVPSICDHPDCSQEINRGLAFVCGDMHDGGEHGCGLYFCHRHIYSLCERCTAGKEPFTPKPDTDEWLRWKLTDESWARWRQENPAAVAEIRKRPQLSTPSHSEP